MTDDKANFLMDRINQCPFNQEIGIHAVKVEDGYAEIAADVSARSVNIWGLPHGGLLFSVADVAAGLAAQSLHDATVVTISANVNFIQSDRQSKQLLAIGRHIKRGKSVGFFHVEVFSQAGTLLLTGQYVMHFS